MKRERDQFVALAFCPADVLIEADANCKISYADGGTVGVTDYSSDELVGDSLLKIIASDDRPILRELIRGMTVGKRLKPIPITKRGSTTIGACPFIVGMVWRAGFSMGIAENLQLGRIAPNSKMPADNVTFPMSEDELDWQSSYS